jgi:hypothetical protein
MGLSSAKSRNQREKAQNGPKVPRRRKSLEDRETDAPRQTIGALQRSATAAA